MPTKKPTRKKTMPKKTTTRKKVAQKSLVSRLFGSRAGLFMLVFGLLGVGMIVSSLAATDGPDNRPKLSAGQFEPGELLVRFRENVPEETKTKLLERFSARKSGEIPQIKVLVINVPEQALEAVQTALSKNPAIESAEKNYTFEISETVPNDTFYTTQKQIVGMTQTDKAWDLQKGIPGVTIAVLDTGVNPVADIAGPRLLPGYDFVNGDNNPADDNGHGTAVAGVAAATTDNATGVAGYCWNCSVLPVKTMRADGSGSYSTVAQGITYAADQGARVINLSIGSVGTTHSAMDSAIAYATAKGAIVVVSAGNSGVTPEMYPSANPSAIAVAGTDTVDNLTSWSNYGPNVELAASGTNYTTTMSGTYGSAVGTSFSAPLVAGIVGLLISDKPTASIDEIKKALFTSTDPIKNTDGKTIQYGRVNAYKALNTLRGTPIPPADSTAPAVQITGPVNGATISSQVDITINATDNSSVSRVEYFRNGVLVGTDSNAPYSFFWDTLTTPNGSYNLTARATDSSNNVATSSPVTVTVNNPTVADTTAPTVTIASPAQNSKTTKKVLISASASDNVGVKSMEILIDGRVAATGTSDSLRYSWNTGGRGVANGNHTIVVRATDGAGNTGSTSVTVVK